MDQMLCQANNRIARCLLHAGFLLRLLFKPEDQGDMFFQNIG
jgi:hypothetical protein